MAAERSHNACAAPEGQSPCQLHGCIIAPRRWWPPLAHPRHAPPARRGSPPARLAARRRAAERSLEMPRRRGEAEASGAPAGEDRGTTGSGKLGAEFKDHRQRLAAPVPLPGAVSWSLHRAVRIREGPGAGVVVPSWWHGQSVAVPLSLSGDADTRARETSRARLEGRHHSGLAGRCAARVKRRGGHVLYFL
jgi:hypothetical protein